MPVNAPFVVGRPVRRRPLGPDGRRRRLVGARSAPTGRQLSRGAGVRPPSGGRRRSRRRVDAVRLAASYEWECVELAMRFMVEIYGVHPYSANGDRRRRRLQPERRRRPRRRFKTAPRVKHPEPGDVISFSDGGEGHVVVVASSDVDAYGNGSITRAVAERHRRRLANTRRLQLVGRRIQHLHADRMAPRPARSRQSVSSADGHDDECSARRGWCAVRRNVVRGRRFGSLHVVDRPRPAPARAGPRRRLRRYKGCAGDQMERPVRSEGDVFDRSQLTQTSDTPCRIRPLAICRC